MKSKSSLTKFIGKSNYLFLTIRTGTKKFLASVGKDKINLFFGGIDGTNPDADFIPEPELPTPGAAA